LRINLPKNWNKTTPKRERGKLALCRTARKSTIRSTEFRTKKTTQFLQEAQKHSKKGAKKAQAKRKILSKKDFKYCPKRT